MKKYLFIFGILIYGCKSGTKENNISNREELNSTNNLTAPNKISVTELKEKIIGIWTDGESENATFQISRDSIYYVDNIKNYNYSLDQDSIKINYLDFTYSGKLSFINDTLVMESNEDVSKFWKFEN